MDEHSFLSFLYFFGVVHAYLHHGADFSGFGLCAEAVVGAALYANIIPLRFVILVLLVIQCESCFIFFLVIQVCAKSKKTVLLTICYSVASHTCNFDSCFETYGW